MEGLGEGLEDEDEGEDDHGDGGDPGDDVEEDGVGVLTHEVFAVDEEKNEDDHDGEPDAVADLRENKNFPERCVGQQDNAATDDNEDGVEPVEGGSFLEFVVEARFEAETFADDVSGRERKDGGGEERGVEETEGESEAGPLAGERNERFGGFGGVVDAGEAGAVERGGGAEDDEENDDHATDAAEQDVELGLGILPRADFFLDEAGLEIEELPGGDGGANERGEGDEIAGVEMDAGDESHAGSENPIGMGEQRRKKIGQVEDAGNEEDDFDLAVVPFQNENPDEQGGDRDGDVFADAEDLRGGGNAGEFGDDVAEIDEEADDHDEESGAETEFFTDEVGEAFSGDDTEASAHFFGDVESDGHGDEGPEKRVAVGGASLRVGGDAAGVVIDVGGDDARTDDGEEESDAAAPEFAAGEEGEDAAAEGVDEDVDGGEGHRGSRQSTVDSSQFRRRG